MERNRISLHKMYEVYSHTNSDRPPALIQFCCRLVWTFNLNKARTRVSLGELQSPVASPLIFKLNISVRLPTLSQVDSKNRREDKELGELGVKALTHLLLVSGEVREVRE